MKGNEGGGGREHAGGRGARAEQGRRETSCGRPMHLGLRLAYRPGLGWRCDPGDDRRCKVGGGGAAAGSRAPGGHGEHNRLLQNLELVGREVAPVVKVGGGLDRLDQLVWVVRRRGRHHASPSQACSVETTGTRARCARMNGMPGATGWGEGVWISHDKGRRG